MKHLFKAVLLGISLLALPAGVSGQDPAKVAEGARTWAQNCTRCHNARSPLERNDSDWAIIVGHMRARANLTKRQATMVTIYLQTVNRPEGAVVVMTPQPQQAASDKEPAVTPPDSPSGKKPVGKRPPAGS